MLCMCSQSRLLVNHIVKLHAEYHAEQLRKGFEGVCVLLEYYCSNMSSILWEYGDIFAHQKR